MHVGRTGARGQRRPGGRWCWCPPSALGAVQRNARGVPPHPARSRRALDDCIRRHPATSNEFAHTFDCNRDAAGGNTKRGRSPHRTIARTVARRREIPQSQCVTAVVGLAIFHPTEGKIEAVYVDNNHRNRDVGTCLLEHAISTIRTDSIVLDCAQDNEAGCRFWERRGFVSTGEGEAFDPQCDRPVPTWHYVLERPAAPPANYRLCSAPPTTPDFVSP